MSITTGAGDKGESGLFSGERISKSNPRLDAIGDIDELVSVLGIAKCASDDEYVKEMLLFAQESLFSVASEIATANGRKDILKKHVDKAMLKELDEKRNEAEKRAPVQTDFIIPGNTIGSAQIDHARAIARRCERKAVKLYNMKIIENKIILSWLNRLSDFLYLLARIEENKS